VNKQCEVIRLQNATLMKNISDLFDTLFVFCAR